MPSGTPSRIPNKRRTKRLMTASSSWLNAPNTPPRPDDEPPGTRLVSDPRTEIGDEEPPSGNVLLNPDNASNPGTPGKRPPPTPGMFKRPLSRGPTIGILDTTFTVITEWF